MILRDRIAIGYASQERMRDALLAIATVLEDDRARMLDQYMQIHEIIERMKRGESNAE